MHANVYYILLYTRHDWAIKKKMFTTCGRHCCMYILLLYNMRTPNISLVRGYNIKAVYITLLPDEERDTYMIFLLLGIWIYTYILSYYYIILFILYYTLLYKSNEIVIITFHLDTSGRRAYNIVILFLTIK